MGALTFLRRGKEKLEKTLPVVVCKRKGFDDAIVKLLWQFVYFTYVFCLWFYVLQYKGQERSRMSQSGSIQHGRGRRQRQDTSTASRLQYTRLQRLDNWAFCDTSFTRSITPVTSSATRQFAATQSTTADSLLFFFTKFVAKVELKKHKCLIKWYNKHLYLNVKLFCL